MPLSTTFEETIADNVTGTACLIPGLSFLPARPDSNPRQTDDPKTSTVQGLEDKALALRIQNGDDQAAEALVERLYPTIIKLVRCHLPRRTNEEDLVQAVFLKIFQKLNQFSGLAPLEHWVSRITINTCINQLGHEKVRPELRMSDLSEEEEIMVQHLASRDNVPNDQIHAAREVLEKLLAHLNPDERLVVTLLHLEERSTAQISRFTGWSVSRVKVKAFRARHKLRKLWKTLLQSEKP